MYKQAAPKFISAGSIKMHQAKSFSSQKMQQQQPAQVNSSSIRNFTETKRNPNNQQSAGAAFKRQRGGYVMGPHGRPLMMRP